MVPASQNDQKFTTFTMASKTFPVTRVNCGFGPGLNEVARLCYKISKSVRGLEVMMAVEDELNQHIMVCS